MRKMEREPAESDDELLRECLRDSSRMRRAVGDVADLLAFFEVFLASFTALIMLLQDKGISGKHAVRDGGCAMCGS
jgi:hypothetical protein